MERIFSFALGNMWQWEESKNRDILIKYAKKLPISGVEITFATKKEVYLFKLSENSKSWLRSLDYVTIHAPFKLVAESENEEEIIRQLDIISKIYDNINAKNVIIHPDYLPKAEILKKYNFNISTENVTPDIGITIPGLRKILNKYSKIELCLDVSHAYLWSKYETSKLIKAFMDRITQIHFSGTYRRKPHQFFQKVTKDFLFSIQPIKKLNVPIVIEEDIKVKSLKFVKEEIKCIKEFFKTVREPTVDK